MAANTALELVNLDFDANKTSLITFLRSQPVFKDYDFEGSELNVLIDLLTYNTLKNAFYLNMALSEGFIDSAQLRPSVLSHAKELNYLPRSARSSKANVTVSFQATGERQPYVIQKGSSFTAQVKTKSFIFSIPETLTCASANTSFSFTTDIYEGAYVKESYVFDTTTKLPLRFKITNQNVDTDSIVVNVFEDDIIGVIFKRTISLLDLDGSSKVYFIQTSAVDGLYEIMFGDNVVGYRPKNGSLIVIDYRITEGSKSNGSGRFAINFDPTSPFIELTSAVSVVTNQSALGGDEQEDIETTRFYAPRWFQTQERAIVPTDYSVLMKTEFPEIHAINVYGGEQLNPPEFGKVVVVLSISNVIGLPQSKEQQYFDFLKARCPLTIFPVFILPQFTFIKISTLVRYNVNITSESASRISTIVLGAISDYNTLNLNDFNATFRLSKFVADIDNSDPSIVSNVTTATVYKKTNPIPNIPQNMIIDFEMALVNDLPALATVHPVASEKTLTSSNFTFKGQLMTLEDDGLGNVRIVQAQTGSYNTVATVGQINYDTGMILLTNFNPDSFEGDNLTFFVRARDEDIACTLSTILGIEPNNVDINIEQLRV